MEITCLYNKHFFIGMYKYMIQEQVTALIDASNTKWTLLEVEEMLIKNYGYNVGIV